MIADRVRMDAFTKALRQAIKPDSVVLDIGTGTGIFALLACQFGARRVYAIELDDAIQVARQIAVANGYGDRIEFIQALSTKVTLPERADVLVSDIGGMLPWFQKHIPSIVDARNRLLAPDAILIPAKDTAWAAVVEAHDLYSELTAPWDENHYRFDMQAARQIVTNTWRKARITADQLLTEARCWATLDYSTVENADISAKVTWTAARAGTGHGLGVWFDRVVSEDIYLSNAPGAPETTSPKLIYGHAFFPWSAPVSITSGDTVSVSICADLIGDDYIWRWDTCVLAQGDPQQVKADFKQSSFFGAPLSVTRLQKRRASHVPDLDENGEIDRFILGSMDGETALGEIARRVSERFSDRFPRWEEALTRVGKVSQKYSQ